MVLRQRGNSKPLKIHRKEYIMNTFSTLYKNAQKEKSFNARTDFTRGFYPFRHLLLNELDSAGVPFNISQKFLMGWTTNAMQEQLSVKAENSTKTAKQFLHVVYNAAVALVAQRQQ